MSNSDLSLEKINAERITNLERKIDRLGELMDKKIDSIAGLLTKELLEHSNGNNGESKFECVPKAVSLVFAIATPFCLLAATMIWNMHTQSMEAFRQHEKIDGHPSTLENVAELSAIIEGHATLLASIEKNVSNFKEDRDKITDNEVRSTSLEHRFLDLKQQIDKHFDGHPADIRMILGELARKTTGNRDEFLAARDKMYEIPQRTVTEVYTLNPNLDPRHHYMGGFKDPATVKEIPELQKAE